MGPEEIKLAQAGIEHAGGDSDAQSEFKIIESFANAAMAGCGQHADAGRAPQDV